MSWFSADSSTQQYDQRVAATDAATALGAGARLNTGVELSGVQGGVTIGDAGAARELAALFAQTVQQTASNQTAVVDRVLQSMAGLAEVKATEGESLKLKLLWGVVIAGAVLGAVWLFVRR